jgi:hypothetical protein
VSAQELPYEPEELARGHVILADEECRHSEERHPNC